MKGTNDFKLVIENHLKVVAEKDPLFAETLKKENKNIDDCITYILNTVKKSGCNGFSDDEVFGMAVHYYDEDDIKVGKKVSSATIISNHTNTAKASKSKEEKTIELSEADKESIRKAAIDKAIADEAERLKKKHHKKDAKVVSIPSLFD